jgi:hypothetical protein
VALWLEEQGLRARPLLGGLDSWLAAGYPVEAKEGKRVA